MFISSKYIDLRYVNGRLVSLVQNCNVLPYYTAHATTEAALEYLEAWAEKNINYMVM